MKKDTKPDPSKALMGARIRAAREAVGLTQAEFARQVGMAQQSVAQWETGLAAPRHGKIGRVAEVLRTTVQFLLVAQAGSDGADLGISSQFHPVLPGRVPIAGKIIMNASAAWSESTLVGGFLEFFSPDAKAYALQMIGDALHPRVQSGEFIVIEPGTVPQPGDEVVIHLADGTHLVRILIRAAGGQTAFSSFDGERLTVDDAQILAIKYIGAIVKPSRSSPPPST